MNYLKRRQKKDRIRSQSLTSIKPDPIPKQSRTSTIAQDWLIICLMYVALVGVVMMWSL